MSDVSDRLTLAATQLNITTEKLGRVTVADLPHVAAYLDALAVHGNALAERAIAAIEHADSDDPIRDVPHGMDAQASFIHASSLLDAVQHFAGDATAVLDQIDTERPQQ